MKFGETGDSIYAYSFGVEEGYSTPSWPYDQAVKPLFSNNDTLIEIVNFGAREHRMAEFNLAFIPRADHYALKAYFEAQKGNKIRVELESQAERVFGEQITATVLYAYLVSYESQGEVGYNSAHGRYAYSVRLDYAGTTSTDIPNGADTSQYDFLIELDCARITAGCAAANKAALDLITTKPGGSRGLALDTRKVYFWNSTVTVAAWEFQYTLPANDAAMGLKNGVFRWSEFSDVSGSSTGVGGEDFKGGWLNKKSIKWPKYSVEQARTGPAVENPQGFSFSIRNDTKMWKFPLEFNLAFQGARGKLMIYDRLSGILVGVRAGYNNRNMFDLVNLEFQIEPSVLLTNKSFPVDTVTKALYPDAAEAARGKPVMATYGRFDKGELQAIAFNMDATRFPNGKKLVQVLAWNPVTFLLTLDVPPDQVTGALGYDYATYPATNNRFLYCAIYAQQGQADVKKLRKVNLVANASGSVLLTLDAGFASPVDTTAQVVVYISNVQITIDRNEVVGFRAADYLKKGDTNGKAPMELFGKVDNLVKPIPPNTFQIVIGSLEGQITVNTNNISLESNGAITVADTVPLENLSPFHLHAVMDKVHVNGYSYFDFAFHPAGVESNKFNVYPTEKPTKQQFIQTGAMMIAQNGRARASFSGTFATIIWTPVPGASSYRITRHKVLVKKAKGESEKDSVLKNALEYLFIDSTFGTGTGVKLADGSTAAASNGAVTIPAGDQFVAIDYSVNTAADYDYIYHVHAQIGSAFNDALISDVGRCRAVPSGNQGLIGLGVDGAVVLTWPVPASQIQFTIKQDGNVIAGMPVVSSSRGWYKVTGLTNNTRYDMSVQVASLAIGTGGDLWFTPAGTVSDHGVHQLLHSGDPYAVPPYSTLRDNPNCILTDDTDLAYIRSWGVVVKKRTNDSLELPSAAATFSWAWKLDKEKLGDMSGARDVRVLADFCTRSWTGTDTQVPFFIQLRGIMADKSVAFTKWYGPLDAKAPTEGGHRGAYARFENLPKDLAASNSNANYDTEQNSSNAAALYTGKDLWLIPDFVFEDGAYIWNQIEYLVFTITNANPIPYSQVKQDSGGYHLGIGGPPGATWTQVKNHKPNLYVEYVRQIDGGLSEPLFARIDGGRIDDGAGTITGTPGRIIEKARHVTDHVVSTMLGQKPKYIGSEMATRDGWIWRWQAKEARSILETLQTLADNINGVFTFTPDDTLYLRNLDIDDPNASVVFNFTDDNIIRRSLGKTETRARTEIYQKILARYNIEATKGGTATEEMMVGWDLAANKALYSGYAMVGEDSSGKPLDLGGLDGLDDLCRLSTQINAAGLSQNEYGTDPNSPKVFEMFYRPTEPTRLTREPKERELPNLSTLWAGTAKAPKMAMQERFRMLVKSLCFDTWYFPFNCSMRNVIHNPAILGKKDEAGTADTRLKLMDLVTVASDHKTNGQVLRGFLLDIDFAPIYDGEVTLHFFAPRPPGQYGPLLDNVWDAGILPRNEANYLFKGSLYGLISEDGTFADAGIVGSRNETNFRFPDGTYADPQGTGTGKA